MIELKDNYQDDVLDSEKNQLRKYNMIHNDDGTVSFVDATVYSQNGDNFGAKDVNDIVARIGEVSKAENISYDSDKSVQGAIDECIRTLGYTVSKNLVPYPYYISSSSFVNSGLTWNCDNKGVLTVNGTPTNDCWYNVIHASDKPLLLKKGKYILNGCASNGSNATYRIELLNSNFEVLFSDIGNECEFTLEEDTNVGLRVYVFSGTTLNNAIFKPMISKEGGEFESYVGDLNSRLQYYDYLDIKDKINISTNCHSLISAYVKNGFVHIKGVINESAVIGQNTWLFVINDAKYSPSETMYGNIIYRSSADLNKALDVRIDSSGTCYVWLLNDLAAHTYFSLMYPIN